MSFWISVLAIGVFVSFHDWKDGAFFFLIIASALPGWLLAGHSYGPAGTRTSSALLGCCLVAYLGITAAASLTDIVWTLWRCAGNDAYAWLTLRGSAPWLAIWCAMTAPALYHFALRPPVERPLAGTAAIGAAAAAVTGVMSVVFGGVALNAGLLLRGPEPGAIGLLILLPLAAQLIVPGIALWAAAFRADKAPHAWAGLFRLSIVSGRIAAVAGCIGCIMLLALSQVAPTLVVVACGALAVTAWLLGNAQSMPDCAPARTAAAILLAGLATFCILFVPLIVIQTGSWIGAALLFPMPLTLIGILLAIALLPYGA